MPLGLDLSYWGCACLAIMLIFLVFGTVVSIFNSKALLGNTN